MPRLTQCPCGSGEVPEAVLDGHGIFLCYACDKCKAEKLSHYREDIFDKYECEEPIEPEDDDYPPRCSNPAGHSWICTGTAYGGDDPSYHGEGRCYCQFCGADGDG